MCVRFFFLGGGGYQDGRPDQSVNKGYKLYSGTRYVAIWTPSFSFIFRPITLLLERETENLIPVFGLSCCNIPHTVHFIRRLCRRVCTCFLRHNQHYISHIMLCRAPDNFWVQCVFTPWFLTQCWFSNFKKYFHPLYFFAMLKRKITVLKCRIWISFGVIFIIALFMLVVTCYYLLLYFSINWP